MGYSGMLAETDIIPQRLFDSTLEKCEAEYVFENQSMHDETKALVSDDSTPSSSAEMNSPMSPRAPSHLADMRSLMSPSLRCLESPMLTTPKQKYYVPETPSPDRMHCLWKHPTMAFSQPAMPWQMGGQAAAAFQAHENV